MAAAETEDLAELPFEDVANYDGTIGEAAEAGLFPQPDLMDFNTWQNSERQWECVRQNVRQRTTNVYVSRSIFVA